MSRTLSSPALAAIYAQETREVFLELLTITHAALPSPIRLVNNPTDVTSRGNVYIRFPFLMRFHADQNEEIPNAELQTDNVSQELLVALRAISGRAIVVAEMVLASSPDVVEYGPMTYKLIGFAGDATQLTLTLSYEPLTSEPYPSGIFNPTDWPGLFNAVARHA